MENDNLETPQQQENVPATADQTQTQLPGSETSNTPADSSDLSDQLNVINTKLDQMISALDPKDQKPETFTSQVYLRNGDQFDFVNQVTIGDALIASGIFLLLSFQVIKWILDLSWKRRS